MLKDGNTMRTTPVIVRIDARTWQYKSGPLSDEYRLLGGRGLTSTIVENEVDPTCDALGPKNKIVFASGLLGGTGAPCAVRLSIGSKSPLTGRVKESNGGGTAALRLSKLGIRAIIVENQPENGQWKSLVVKHDGVTFMDADPVLGKGTYDTAKYYQEVLGKSISIIAIGPAGENKYCNSSIAVTDRDGNPARQCARGGLGSVLGSKGIKAIIIDDKQGDGPYISNPRMFKEICVNWAKELVSTKSHLTKFGTAYLVEIINEIGGLPTRNFSAGQFEYANRISGEKLRNTIIERGGDASHSCYLGCPIKCSNVYIDKDGGYLTSAIEYETIGLLGSNLGIGDLDTIAKLDRFCDDYGLDTIELGAAIGVLMEAGFIQFGDHHGIMNLLKEILERTALGRMVCQGAAVTGKVMGVKRVPVCKSQALSSYDPRILKATGVTYISSPQGADHTAGNCPPGRVGFRNITKNALEMTQIEGQADLSIDIQIMSAVCDCMGVCLFVGANASSMAKFAALINSHFGLSITESDVIDLGRKTIISELAFNKKAGYNKSVDMLPEFFQIEPLPPKNAIFDVPEDMVVASIDEGLFQKGPEV
jgi:aldehyde:ferredoxin oxidoreductase